MPTCTHCGYQTSSRGPFGEALHPECWEEQDEDIARVERRTAEKHGYDTSYYARVDEAKQIADAHVECERLNPHFTTAQAVDWVFTKIFGEFQGTELDKRNYALCK